MSLPPPIAFYYGWPGEVNGAAGHLERAAGAFGGYECVVLGEGNVLAGADPAVAALVPRLGPRARGYVDLGVTHGSRAWPMAKLVALMTAWRDLGATGVMLDCAGSDYGVSRHRFVGAVDAAHEMGLSVIANSWRPDDVLSGASPLGPGDAYLGENLVLTRGRWAPPPTAHAKLEAMAEGRRKLGIRLLATATAAADRVREACLLERLEAALSPYRLDGLAITDPRYSATTNHLAPPFA